MKRPLKVWIASLLLGVLAGCASVASQQGKSSLPTVTDVGKAVYVDAVTVMTQVFPPAQTQLVVARPMTDVVDLALLESLRKSGYAVAEPERSGARDNHAPGANPTGLLFDTRIDQIGNGTQYLMTITVGSVRLGRMYVLDGERIYPGGDWTHREQ